MCSILTAKYSYSYFTAGVDYIIVYFNDSSNTSPGWNSLKESSRIDIPELDSLIFTRCDYYILSKLDDTPWLNPSIVYT